MDVPDGVEPIIVVVENDEFPTCQGLMLRARAGSAGDWQIHYAHEPRLGIPIARNRALDVALQLNADWVAFIDDDEVATPTWLRAMHEAIRKYPSDVFQGPVEYVYPADTPDWIEQKKLRRRESGSQLTTAYTNNVMMRASVASADGLNLRFNEELRFTGGSDTEYYCRAVDNGAVIRWVDEALVKEPVTPDRLSISWNAKRAMRVAANSSALHVRRFGIVRALGRYAPKFLVRLLRGAGMALVGMPLVALRVKAGHKLMFRGLKDIYSGIGGLGAFTSFMPQPYLQIDGDNAATCAALRELAQRQPTPVGEKKCEAPVMTHTAQANSPRRAAAGSV
jgi:succinoglycan biosynthesis protein ExoM